MTPTEYNKLMLDLAMEFKRMDSGASLAHCRNSASSILGLCGIPADAPPPAEPEAPEPDYRELLRDLVEHLQAEGFCWRNHTTGAAWTAALEALSAVRP